MLNTGLVDLFGTLGISGVFLYLYFKDKDRHNKKNDEKDKHIAEMHSKVLNAFSENTRVQQQQVNTLKENTEATKTLARRIEDILRK